MIEQSVEQATVQTELDRRLAAMPKAEIHVHLEGATAPDASYAIARRNKVDLPVASLDEWRRYFDFRDFPHFIDVYRNTTDTIRTTDDLALMVAQFYVDQARQNIRYSECFISMSLHLRRLSAAEILDALAQGIERGQTVSSARVAFIADISREDPHTQGAVLDQMGRHADAQRYYLTALKIMPDESSVLSNLGLSYALSKNLREAESTLRRAAAHPPVDPRVRQNLALVIGLQGRFAEAETIARADLPPDEAAANVAYLRQMLAHRKDLRDPNRDAHAAADSS